jgi:hypothetical protein
LRRTFLVITLLCCVTLCFGVVAVNTPVKIGLNEVQSGLVGFNAPVADNAPTANPPVTAPAVPASVSQGNITISKQDSGTNLTIMNITFTNSPTYGLAQAVEFKAPKPGWILAGILVMATDGWNASSKELPKTLPFTLDVRDENLMLLYHHEGVQLPYFTNSNGVRMATIDVPPMPLNGTFYVCFYGYGSISLADELQNATGNSYYYDERAAQLHRGVLPLRNNQTIPVNWLIRVAGQ